MNSEFESYLDKIVGMRPQTCRRFCQTVERFEHFCLNQQRTLLNADRQLIVLFLDSLDLKPMTKVTLLAALRRYYQFLVYNGDITLSPTKNVPSPKRAHYERTQFSVEDIAALLNTTSKEPVGIRDRAIMTLLYATGMRCSEVRMLKLVDLDLDNSLLRVFGKNEKERLIPINAIAIDCLQNYLAVRPSLFVQGRSSPYLFITKAQSHAPLNSNSIWKVVKRAAKKAQLGEQFTTHNLRHAFATHMVQNGANLRVIQELLGHAQLSTTQIYIQLDKAHLKELHTQYHPRAK